MQRRVAILILAGGRATRLGGGDKPLLTLAGQSILTRLLARLHHHNCPIALNVNGEQARFSSFNLPILSDSLSGYPGPLAGVLAGLDWAASHGFTTMLSVPGDCPFIPRDLLSKLIDAQGGTNASSGQIPVVCAASAGRTHFVTTLWPVASRSLIRAALEAGERRVEHVLNAIGHVQVEWPAEPYDPFFNINTPEDMQEAEEIIRLHPGADIRPY